MDPNKIACQNSKRSKPLCTLDTHVVFQEKLKGWEFTPIRIEPNGTDEDIVIHFTDFVTKDRYVKTIEHLIDQFPNLPSLLEFTRCTPTPSGHLSSLTMSTSAYSLLKIASYCQYVLPFNMDAPTPQMLTNTPQFPHLLQMFATENYDEIPFAMDSFSRVVRAWMAFVGDNMTYTPKLDYKDISYRERSVITRKLSTILDLMSSVFSYVPHVFLEFLKVNAVGATIVYNFLCMPEINLVHKSLLTEIQAHVTRGCERTARLSRKYLSFLMEIEYMMSNLSYDANGYANVTRHDNKGCCRDFLALVMQFYAFVCDPDMDTTVSLMLLCLVTSSNTDISRNIAMLQYAAALKKMGKSDTHGSSSASTSDSSPTCYNANVFSLSEKKAKTIVPSILDYKPIEYLARVKTNACESPLLDTTLYSLHLFLASLECQIYPTKLKLAGLPLFEFYEQKDVKFPFNATQSLCDVFFLINT